MTPGKSSKFREMLHEAMRKEGRAGGRKLTARMGLDVFREVVGHAPEPNATYAMALRVSGPDDRPTIVGLRISCDHSVPPGRIELE